MITSTHSVFANQAGTIYPVAIFHFVEKSDHLSEMGEKVSDLVFANLSAEPDISLVDRNELEIIQDEMVLNLSGMVNTQEANQVGMLTGAKIIITGTIFELESKLVLVAKIIGTETSRVMGVTIQGDGNGGIISLTRELSTKILDTINENADSLVAKPIDSHDRVATLMQKLETVEKPSLSIRIKERHVNRATSEPAAETEMILLSTESGFEVIDNRSNKAKGADILITGEGFSEFATRKGDIVGVKARLEVKAIDQATKKIIAVDRQTVIEVDLSEIIASKKALERASAMIAERLLPKLAGQ
ncbi:MAG: CsgG/HfaB family protein [Candidatus Thiodiazotropha endolucinida]